MSFTEQIYSDHQDLIDFKSDIEIAGLDMPMMIFYKDWQEMDSFGDRLWAMAYITRWTHSKAADEMDFLLNMVRGG